MSIRRRIQTLGCLAVLLVAAGCIHRGATVQNPKAKVSPDSLLRAVFQQQIQGAFDPLAEDPAVRTLQNRLKINQEDYPARLDLAATYESYGLFNHASTQYSETLRLTRPAAASDDTAFRFAEQAMLGLARSARPAGNLKDAAAVLDEFVAMRPSGSTWNQLGLLYNEMGDYSAAERAFREAIALEPKSDSLRNNLGYNLLLQEKLEAAEAELRTAVKLNPKSATARNNLGIVLARRGEYAEALEQFKSVADAPSAHNNLAVVLLETGEYERSREELVKALTLRQYFAPALANFKLVQERIRERAELRKQQLLSAESKDPEE